MVAGRTHRYPIRLDWYGNRGHGTSGYTQYGRDHCISVPGKPAIAGSSDPAFRGDPARWNPEELFVASVAACHQLWYLHLASDAGIIVTAYHDDAVGVMVEEADGGGRFTVITLRPTVTIAAGHDADLARTLHHRVHALCYIARSIACTVACEATIATDITPVIDPSV